MVYISADGSVDGSRSRSRNPFKLLTDLFFGLINGILLFFRTISTPPERLPEVSVVRFACAWDVGRGEVEPNGIALYAFIAFPPEAAKVEAN